MKMAANADMLIMDNGRGPTDPTVLRQRNRIGINRRKKRPTGSRHKRTVPPGTLMFFTHKADQQAVFTDMLNQFCDCHQVGFTGPFILLIFWALVFSFSVFCM
jgi:hypothetical protein